MEKSFFIFINIFLLTFSSLNKNAENFNENYITNENFETFDTENKYDFCSQWINKNKTTPLADTFINIIRNSNLDGLDPREYHIREIENIVHHSLNSENKKTLSTLLTDAFVLITTHHYAGRICSEKEGNIDWVKHISEINPYDSLRVVFKNGGIKKMISSFNCKHQQYVALQKKLTTYISIQESGGWSKLPLNLTLKKGEQNKKVILLKKRLASTNDLISPIQINDSIFDESLEESIKVFQYRHALIVNGKVDKNLVNELNIPVEIRIKQIAFNMDRWRWLPRELPDTFIMVNIAGFTLAVKQNNNDILDMKIIAGTTFLPTPLFHSKMSHINLNPGWDIPMSIARNEILPHLKNDNNYLIKNNIIMYESRDSNAAKTDARTISWNGVSPNNFHYRLRQISGGDNPLGSLKFMFPNNNYVYFHDTPFRELFSKNMRAFSHGCMRIEKPFELAAFLLKKDSTWVRNKLNNAISKNKEIKLMVPSQEEVYICYWTTFVNQSGQLCFEKDLYQYDKRMEEFMNTKKCLPYFGYRISVKSEK